MWDHYASNLLCFFFTFFSVFAHGTHIFLYVFWVLIADLDFLEWYVWISWELCYWWILKIAIFIFKLSPSTIWYYYSASWTCKNLTIVYVISLTPSLYDLTRYFYIHCTPQCCYFCLKQSSLITKPIVSLCLCLIVSYSLLSMCMCFECTKSLFYIYSHISPFWCSSFIPINLWFLHADFFFF